MDALHTYALYTEPKVVYDPETAAISWSGLTRMPKTPGEDGCETVDIMEMCDTGEELLLLPIPLPLKFSSSLLDEEPLLLRAFDCSIQ
jgi:hypothetical protein